MSNISLGPNFHHLRSQLMNVLAPSTGFLPWWMSCSWKKTYMLAVYTGLHAAKYLHLTHTGGRFILLTSISCYKQSCCSSPKSVQPAVFALLFMEPQACVKTQLLTITAAMMSVFNISGEFWTLSMKPHMHDSVLALLESLLCWPSVRRSEVRVAEWAISDPVELICETLNLLLHSQCYVRTVCNTSPMVILCLADQATWFPRTHACTPRYQYGR